MNVLDLLQQSRITVKRVASTHGGEFAGPCPLCGGTDRFRVWPEQKEGGAWWCRGCGKGGDSIRLLRDVRGMGYLEAVSFLGGETGEGWPGSSKKAPAGDGWIPRSPALPCEAWRAKAADFVTKAEGSLAGNSGRVRWLLEERGLTGGTVRAARLGWNATDLFPARATWGLTGDKRLWLPAGLIIPCFGQDRGLFRLKVRRPRQDEPRYVHVAGGSSMTWVLMGGTGSCLVVVESELDGLLLWQEAGDLTGIVILGSAQTRPDAESTARLKAAETVFVSLDADAAGAKQTWAWWTKHFPKARRWPPVRGKDVTDMWQAGVPLQMWIQAGLEGCWPTGLQRGSLPPAIPETRDTGNPR